MNKTEYIKRQLDKAVEKFNRFEFVENDPIQIPHRFSKKEDIEIAGFLSSTIAWGNRKMIIKNCYRLLDLMDNSPYEFIVHFEKMDKHLSSFVHRTFQGEDLHYFILALKNIYTQYGGLEEVFNEGYAQDKTIFSALSHFRTRFLELPHQKRTEKHISNVMSNSAAKRLNMFLRWMVRKDENGVDLGLWSQISMSDLMLPLDIHTGRVSRELGLLKRKQNDWKAVEEITQLLREFDRNDPIKYDYALFGIGVNNITFVE